MVGSEPGTGDLTMEFLLSGNFIFHNSTVISSLMYVIPVNFSLSDYVSLIITGRNEVVAKVMFLHVSVILFTGGASGEPPRDQGEPPLDQADTPPGTRQTPPPKKTAEYGQ